jgi:flavorubredoxin
MIVGKGGPSNPVREIAEGIWWLPQCLVRASSEGVLHLHAAPYLICGSDKTLLWDTGPPPQWEGVTSSLDEILGERQLDYIVPSHPEVAHCGNAERLLNKYPDALLIGDVRDYAYYLPRHTDRIRAFDRAGTLDLGTHAFTFLPGLIKDLPSTQWAYESTSDVLFVGDAFAYSHLAPANGDAEPTHRPGECTLLASELDAPPRDEQIIWITKAALYWTRFVPIDVYLEDVLKLLDDHPTRLVAPGHGAVIDDVDGVLWLIWEALRRAYDPPLGVEEARAVGWLSDNHPSREPVVPKPGQPA